MSRLLARVPSPTDRKPGEADDDPLMSFQAEADTVVLPSPEVPSGSTTRRRSRLILVAAVLVLAVVGGGLAYFQLAVGRVAAAAPAVPPTGNVTFTSQPDGATVTIDGVARGVTPLKLALSAGQHEAEIALESSKRIVPIAVEPNALVAEHFEFAVTAIAQTGRLDVATDPAGARVSIDGTARGTTPLSIPAIAVGEHKVTIIADSRTIQRSVTVAAGAAATVMVAVNAPGSAGGWAQIKAPMELQVFEDGQLIGSTSTSRVMLPAGRHDVEVVNAALEFRAPIRLEIEPGKTTTASVAIPNGSLSVNALPWADVSIDGRPVGTTPLGNLSVPIGTHEVVWRHPQLGQRTRTISVTARTPVRVGMDFSK